MFVKYQINRLGCVTYGANVNIAFFNRHVYLMVHCTACTRKHPSSSRLLENPMGPFYQQELIIFLAWIRNHMPGKVWNEVTYPFANFNGTTVEVWEWISNILLHFIMDVITYPCWDQKLKNIRKRGPRMTGFASILIMKHTQLWWLTRYLGTHYQLPWCIEYEVWCFMFFIIGSDHDCRMMICVSTLFSHVCMTLIKLNLNIFAFPLTQIVNTNTMCCMSDNVITRDFFHKPTINLYHGNRLDWLGYFKALSTNDFVYRNFSRCWSTLWFIVVKSLLRHSEIF